MPKKNELPKCPACQSKDTYVVTSLPNGNLFKIECDSCDEESGWFGTRDEAIALWTRAAEKRRALEALAAKVPVFSKKLPDSEGLWWWRETKDSDALLLSLSNDGLGELWAQHHHGELLPKEGPVDMGGYWAKCLPPEMPEEPAFGRNVDKALKDGEAARIAATEERIKDKTK